jgi:activating signal cointegrator complex subunit 2
LRGFEQISKNHTVVKFLQFQVPKPSGQTSTVMEEVAGIPGSLPPLAQFPSQSIISSILPEEWQACLDAWIFAVEFRLRLLPDHFRHFQLSLIASGIPFLLSYYRQWDYDPKLDAAYRPGDGKELRLHRQCFLLSRRLLTETDPPYDCSSKDLFALIANVSLALGTTTSWKETLKIAWKRSKDQIAAAIETCKSSLISELPGSLTIPSDSVLLDIRRATALAKALPEAGEYLMTGSDYLDSLASGYPASPSTSRGPQALELSNALTENIFVCFRSLMISDPPHTSLLLDHLYSLKATADRITKANPDYQTILSSLVCLTSFLKHLHVFTSTHEQKRGSTLVKSLYSYRELKVHLHPTPVKKRSKVQKGKAKAAPDGDMHIHQASRISQIHDLFPDLSSAYIIRLLDHFSDDIEAVTAALLEPDSLPADLQNRDVDADTQPQPNRSLLDLEPQEPLPDLPQRRNIFDGDDFDNLRISSSKIHKGHKDKTIETPANPNEHTKAKAAIMAALAAFDSDDDERDDTYDVGDVGGTVDTSIHTDSRSRAQKPLAAGDDAYEEVLFGAWRNTPQIFARDSKTRLSQPRQKLKQETGMSDEQIEGWAVMLGRDKALLSSLEKKYSMAFGFGGQQHKLAGTKWSASRSGTGTEDDDSGDDGADQASGGGRGRGAPLGRGARGFGRGRGGSTSGPSYDPATQAARRRKEQGRGRGGANHNRREGRAKKVGRGMAGPVA